MTKYNGVKTLEVLEGADNYNGWIASRIRPYLIPPVLEIGAGTGNISEHFKELNDLTLTDIDPNLVDKLAKKFIKNGNVKVETFDISAVLGKFDNRFKSIYSVNVLEHIENDELAFRNINKLLEKKGILVLLVPAKKYAYNKLDKKLGHYRRYEKNELGEKLNEANFRILQIGYFNIVGLLSWMVREKVSKNSELKPYQIKAFDWIVPALRLIEPKKNLPMGISLIAVAQKK